MNSLIVGDRVKYSGSNLQPGYGTVVKTISDYVSKVDWGEFGILNYANSLLTLCGRSWPESSEGKIMANEQEKENDMGTFQVGAFLSRRDACDSFVARRIVRISWSPVEGCEQFNGTAYIEGREEGLYFPHCNNYLSSLEEIAARPIVEGDVITCSTNTKPSNSRIADKFNVRTAKVEAARGFTNWDWRHASPEQYRYHKGSNPTKKKKKKEEKMSNKFKLDDRVTTNYSTNVGRIVETQWKRNPDNGKESYYYLVEWEDSGPKIRYCEDALRLSTQKIFHGNAIAVGDRVQYNPEGKYKSNGCFGTVNKIISNSVVCVNWDGLPQQNYPSSELRRVERTPKKEEKKMKKVVKPVTKKVVGTLKTDVTYRINKGRLGGRSLKPEKVCRNREFAFFAHPASNTVTDYIRVHQSQLTEVTPESITQLTESNEDKAMKELWASAGVLVSTENAVRIEKQSKMLLSRTATAKAEIDAIKKGTKQPWNINYTAVILAVIAAVTLITILV